MCWAGAEGGSSMQQWALRGCVAQHWLARRQLCNRKNTGSLLWLVCEVSSHDSHLQQGIARAGWKWGAPGGPIFCPLQFSGHRAERVEISVFTMVRQPQSSGVAPNLLAHPGCCPKGYTILAARWGILVRNRELVGHTFFNSSQRCVSLQFCIFCRMWTY